MRLAGKVAVIIGAGQSPGEGVGNAEPGPDTILDVREAFGTQQVTYPTIVNDTAAAGERV